MENAQLCYSHFRLQVWNRTGRDPGEGAVGKVVNLGMNREREAHTSGVQITYLALLLEHVVLCC